MDIEEDVYRRLWEAEIEDGIGLARLAPAAAWPGQPRKGLAGLRAAGTYRNEDGSWE